MPNEKKSTKTLTIVGLVGVFLAILVFSFGIPEGGCGGEVEIDNKAERAKNSLGINNEMGGGDVRSKNPEITRIMPQKEFCRCYYDDIKSSCNNSSIDTEEECNEKSGKLYCANTFPDAPNSETATISACKKCGYDGAKAKTTSPYFECK